MLLVLASLLVLCRAAAQATPALLVEPQSRNASLGETVLFSCGGSGGILISWDIDNVVLNPDIMASRNITHTSEGPTSSGGMISSNITILASEGNNNTRLHCTLYQSAVMNIQSDNALLKVQGILAQVDDLVIQYGHENSILSWIQPYSLQGVPIRYTIHVSNSNAPEPLLNVETTSTTHQFNSSTWSSCTNYSFTVEASNAVGPGGQRVITNFYPGVPDTPTVSVSNIMFSNNVATITLMIKASPCFLQQDVIVTINVYNSRDSDPQPVHSDTQQEFTNSVFLYPIENLPKNQLFYSTLSYSNMFGETRSPNIMFSTYNVQDINITHSYSNGTTCLECVLQSIGTNTNCTVRFKRLTLSQCPSADDVEVVLGTLNTTLNTISGCTSPSMLLFKGSYNVEVVDDNSISVPFNKEIEVDGLQCIQPHSSSLNSVSTVPTDSIATNSPSVVLITGLTLGLTAVVTAAILSTMIVALICTKMRKRNKLVSYTVNRRSQYTGTSVHIEEIPRKELDIYTENTSDSETTLSPGINSEVFNQEPVVAVQSHVYKEGEFNQVIQPTIADHVIVNDSTMPPPVPPHRSRQQQIHMQPAGVVPYENMQPQIESNLALEALQFRKNNMEVLDYKKRLSGSAYAKDKMDDDDDQMDYDHLHSSDESSFDSSNEDGINDTNQSNPQHHYQSHYHHTRIRQQQQQDPRYFTHHQLHRPHDPRYSLQRHSNPLHFKFNTHNV